MTNDASLPLQASSQQFRPPFSGQELPNHIGLIVADFDQAIETYTKVFQWKMARTQTIKGDFWINGSIRNIQFRIAWSLHGSPHIEFVEMVPGTPLADEGVHHFAYWVADLGAAVANMEKAGFRMEVTRCDDEGRMPYRFAYMVGPGNIRIELMDLAVKPGYDDYLGLAGS